MAHVTIIKQSKQTTVSNMEHGQCFISGDYEGDNFFMRVNPVYFANSSIYKTKADKGMVLVIGMAGGALRMINGAEKATPYSNVEMRPKV